MGTKLFGVCDLNILRHICTVNINTNGINGKIKAAFRHSIILELLIFCFRRIQAHPIRKAVLIRKETVIIYINVIYIKALIIAGMFYARPRFGTEIVPMNALSWQ